MNRRLLLLAAPAAACTSGALQGRSTLADLKARGRLVIGTSGTAPPYSWIDPRDHLIGFDIDLGEDIGRTLGLPVLWKRIDFRGLLPALSAGQLDLVMSAARIRPKLRTAFLFSEPYSYEETVAVTPVAAPRITSVADLRGRDVAVVTSSFQEDVAVAMGGYRTLLALPNGSDVFLALHTGHANVGVVGRTAANHYAKARPGELRIVRAGAPLAPQGIVMALRAHELKRAVDVWLARLRQDGGYRALYLKHFGEPPPGPAATERAA